MQDILTVTLNPAVDISTSVAKLIPGRKLRCARPEQDPGGGGTNVARAITFMGGHCRAFMALGGLNGRKLSALMQREEIEMVAFAAPDETRISLSVIEEATGEQYRFVLPGPSWGASDENAVLSAISQAVRDDGFVVLSGSLPVGLPVHFYADLCAALKDRAVKVIIDTSGPALEHQVTAPQPAPFILRMDETEAEQLAGHPLPERTDTADFAAGLVADRVADAVIVARGAEGSVLVGGGRHLHAAAAKVTVRSKVGAGDSFVAGLTLALARGGDLGEALQWGTAAASAAVMSDATQLCRRADVERLVPECILSEI